MIDLSGLETFFNEGGNQIQKQNEPAHMLAFGNIWFGDFFSNADRGQFGSEKKMKHWGCVTDLRKKKRAARVISPITSQKKSSKAAYVIPGGIIISKLETDSYVLLNKGNQLLVASDNLLNNFSYEGQLPEVYVKELKEKLNVN